MSELLLNLEDLLEMDFDQAFEGIDPNADLDAAPPAPADGVYKAFVTLAAGPKDTKIVAGVDVKGRVITPSFNDATKQIKTDDKGAGNGTLHVRVKVLDADGKGLTSIAAAVFTYVGNNGTSPALSLAKGMGLDVSSPGAIRELVKAHIQTGQVTPYLLEYGVGLNPQAKIQSLVNFLLLDSMRLLIENAGDTGFELAAVKVENTVEAPDGTKKGAYDNKTVKLRTSEKIMAAGHWPAVDTTKLGYEKAKIETKIANFAA